MCKDKKDDELKKWKWQLPLVWLPWIFALVDSLTFVGGFGFYGVYQSWFCGSFVSANSPRAWRNMMLVVVAGTINVLIISTMVMLVKVSSRFLVLQRQMTREYVIYFELSSLISRQ